ncbi:Pre-mRNA-splicing factor 38 [Vanrija pseudolonga]|uniref:Pre-mRNA-splicing factor 38 n=1 Tax=Vanrija pseudolonga TaxID=143232 RepID=A0AAF1BIP0_9TREE|nr:Pre-mRNA-splicing factor 38 [Vanrija pseudolonga]
MAAATTQRGVKALHGSHPQVCCRRYPALVPTLTTHPNQNLIEKVIRERIYESTYWKEHCFATNAETIIDKAIALKAIGGVHDRQTPTEFMCLVLRLLQLQPEKEILMEYLLAEEFKYLRALAVIYIRLAFRSMEVYEILEPLMRDYRKLRHRHAGGYTLTTFDQFVDDLLTQERVCDIILPRLTKRSTLEEAEGLPVRKSLLDEDPREEAAESGGEGEEDGEEGDTRGRKRARLSRTPDSRDSSPDLRRSRSRSRSSSGSSRSRFVSRSPSRSGSEDGDEGDTRARYVSRSPSVSPDRVIAPEGERIEGDV